MTDTATFCATLVDEWVRSGVRHAVIAPGSRSTPLALALAERDELVVHLVHDERAASFVALGIGVADAVPAILLCTSGSAATHFHGAVVEADLGEVPMIVCTADRPPELRDTGAPQTIDQTRLYGTAVRWFHDPGPPASPASVTWRAIAARSVAASTGERPGPVHLNLPFREPLVGQAAALPEPVAPESLQIIRGRRTLAAEQIASLVELLDRQRGVVVVGGGHGVRAAAADLHQLAAELGWPVLADPRSGCRTGKAATVAAFDAILRSREFADAHAPEVVLRMGTLPASRVLAEWLDRSRAIQVQVHASEAWLDPGQRLAVRVVADPGAVARSLHGLMRGRAVRRGRLAGGERSSEPRP
ncbi:MAG: 2-succinyl-5-enolpyruvyl-6-hydroxy-3-cyclohexene-1-carboxylic-acid synthase [Ilumatobacteraceae bacterium]